MRRIASVALLPALAVLSAARPAGARGSPADWPCSWTTFPRETPSTTWPDGPIVGNGNLGLAVGGAPGVATIYGTVHGFWSSSFGENSTMPPLDAAPSAPAAPPGSSFPFCPGANCTITVGLTLLRLSVSSPQLALAWTAQLDIARAVATVSLGGAGGAALELELWASATSQVAVLTLRNSGAVALTGVNVTAAVNDNVQRVPTSTACTDASGVPAACPAPPALAAVLLTKDANSVAARSAFPITAAAAVRPIAADAGAVATATLPFAATEPQYSWATGRSVDTLTSGITSVLSLAPGASVTYALSMAASEDPGVKPATPAQAVGARVAAVTPAGLAPLRAAHEQWWAAHWSASSVALDGEDATEAFWYTALYALGSGTRAGQVTMDLWSPWRTTDYSEWRSNPTMDYNEQALYSGAVAANHVELMQPYYDLLNAAVASGSPAAESAALGCPGGIHFSVDLAPFGLKLGVFGAPQAWGIRSNAVYAAVLHAYQWAASDQTDADVQAWARAQMPFLRGVAAFWRCYFTKVEVPGAPDGYRYHSIGDCDGDENCDSYYAPEVITNPTWTLTYVQRLLETLLSMSAALGTAPDPSWADMLTHLPPTPTTVVNGVAVLSAYGEGAVNTSASQAASFRSEAGYLHALWPGETLSPLSEANATLAAAALATFDSVSWGQDNSFSWMYASAARAGVAPDRTLAHWRAELLVGLRTNRLVAFGGLCSDSLGAVAFVHDMLVQSQEGFVRLFPAWPANQSAAFSTLRMRGAVLVSASYVSRPEWAGLVAGRTGGTANATLLAGASGELALLSPWPAAPTSSVSVVDEATGLPASVSWGSVPGANGGPVARWAASKGHAYLVTTTSAAAR
jgi:hypothetical protein